MISSPRAPLKTKIDLALAFSVAAALSACGGGDSSSPAPVPAPAPTTTTVTTTVIDGAIKGAVVCLDKNGNGACDSGEPSATTDASGTANLTVDNADVGKYPLVVTVGTDAVDADTGPVTTAYVMQAPADATSVVSPYTTLVQAQIDTAGGTSAQAADVVQTATGLKVSALANYVSTRGTDAGAQAASNLARLIVLAQQQQMTSLASVVGQTDLSGSAVTTADLQRAVTRSLLGALPAMATASADPSVAAATTPAGLDTALNTLATTLIANGQAGLTTSAALLAVGTQKLPADTAASTPTAGASFRAFTYTDANNWFYRAMESTAADNTPDANGLVHFYDVRSQDLAGAVTTWGFQSTPARQTDTHWNGTQWTAGCPIGFRSSQLPRDANGHTSYNYCDSYETGVSTRTGVDISGKTLTEVVNTIRATPGGDSGVAYASFGPTDLTLLGTATMPAGSKLWYQYSQSLTEAQTYLPGSFPLAYDAPVANGDPAATACGASTFSPLRHPATSLEELIAANPGTPCVFGQGTAADGSKSLAPSTWWDQTSINLGTLNNVVTPPSAYYTTGETLRIAFTGGSGVTYLNCLQRTSDGSSRNCQAIGTGSYTITTLGDARVMSFSGVPVEGSRLNYSRLIVERGGAVYYGYQSTPGVGRSVRLNLPAANALLTQLGLAPIVPN